MPLFVNARPVHSLAAAGAACGAILLPATAVWAQQPPAATQTQAPATAGAQTAAPAAGNPAPAPTTTNPTVHAAPPGAQPSPGQVGPPGVRFPGQAPPAQKLAPIPKLPPYVFARAGGQDITGADLMLFMTELGGFPLSQERVQIVLAEQQARKYGVTVTKDELDAALKQQENNIVQSQMMQTGQPMTFAEIVARRGQTEGFIRQLTRYQLLLKKAYAKSIANQLPNLDGKVKVSHLLIGTQQTAADAGKPDTPASIAKRDADAFVKITAIKAQLDAGKITWQQAIDANSDDPSKVNNHGSMGWIDKNSQFVPEFLDAALKLTKQGEIGGPVKSAYGWHLIRLDELGSQATPAELADYRKSEQDKMMNPQAISAWFSGIVQNAGVFYNPNASFSASAPATTTEHHSGAAAH